MKIEFRDIFLEKWEKYFANAELPIAYYYTNKVDEKDLRNSKNDFRCLIGNLNQVREGFTFIYSSKSSGCPGGKRYTGYSTKLRPNFEYFLSCGLPGELEGERYKKSPDLVKSFLKNFPPFEAPGEYLVFKRWDKLKKKDQPLAIIFFATSDVLSGLYTLANFDTMDPLGVISPFGSGCSSIINYPVKESFTNNPKCFMGMFDVSARPFVPESTLTFTIPMKRFIEMVENMDESFLITKSWDAVRNRIKKRK